MRIKNKQLDEKKYKIIDIESGSNHTLILLASKENDSFKLVTFGNEKDLLDKHEMDLDFDKKN
jgi:hypothetical protein